MAFLAFDEKDVIFLYHHLTGIFLHAISYLPKISSRGLPLPYTHLGV